MLRFLLVVPALVALVAFAQAGPEVLTNEDVQKLTEAGIPAAAIVAKINGSDTKFDVSVDGLLALAAAGVDKAVIEAMTDSALGSPSSAPPGAGAGLAAGGGGTAHFAGTRCEARGIYVEVDSELRAL